VEEHQIIGSDGTRVTADAIVLATGFHIGELSIASHLHGAQGTPLAHTWRNGRHAYLGTSVSGYPNLFLLLGPNLLNGTTAAPTVMEAQLRYITDALDHLRRDPRASLDVRPEIQDRHQADVQAALQTTVYATDPTSYYYGSSGVNTFCWPWSVRRLRRRLHAFDSDDYVWASVAPTAAHRTV
jgi:cation diffusion facilitator CzcD-associated flavoprotein CzcO